MRITEYESSEGAECQTFLLIITQQQQETSSLVLKNILDSLAIQGYELSRQGNC